MKRGQPKKDDIWGTTKEGRYGPRGPWLFAWMLPGMINAYHKGRQIIVRGYTADDEGFIVYQQIELTVVRAYRRFVLFKDKRGIKHTYTYADLAKIEHDVRASAEA